MVGVDGFVFGVGGLDSLLGGVLRPGSLLVVAGHPGAGKTTLGATLCAANASRGRRCVYFTVQEPRAKMLSNLRGVGVDLERLEEDGLVRIVKLPLVAGEDAVGEVLGEVARTVAEAGASVAVVDSVTPLLKAVGSSVRARSILQEFLASLPETMRGVLVLLAEIPILEERVELGDIEFVADAILLLTHTVERNRLVREIVIRKARGAPITIARLPFTITQKGIQVWVPPNLETIPALSDSKVFSMPCESLTRYVDGLRGGMVVYVAYPSDANPLGILMPVFAGVMIVNNARAVVFSYSASTEQLKEYLAHSLARWGFTIEDTDLIGAYTENIRVYSFNPSGFSLEELYGRQLYMVDELKPDIVVLWGLDSLCDGSRPGFFDMIRNMVLYFKEKGILTILTSSIVDTRYYYRIAQVSDFVLRIMPTDKQESVGRRLEWSAYAWIAGQDPIALSNSKLVSCARESTSTIREYWTRKFRAR